MKGLRLGMRHWVMVTAALVIASALAGSADDWSLVAPGHGPDEADALATVHMRHPLIVRVDPTARAGAPAGINPLPVGYTPQQMRNYLGLSGDGAGQTIAITAAFQNPTIRADVTQFSTQFGLPLPCEPDQSPSGGAAARRGGGPAPHGDCFPFEIAMPSGTPPLDSGWALEIALDVEWAHAIAPLAGILLVEAVNDEGGPLFGAIDYAVAHGASVISNSWLDDEFTGQSFYDRRCRLHRAICVFASGDEGHPAVYPATNPYVLGVGGTSLTLSASGEPLSERAWSGSGGGVSKFERRPRYQSDAVDGAMRGSPDVSYHGDPSAGYPVYIGSGLYGIFGWVRVGGTSAGTPQWAAIIAVADELRAERGKPPFGSINKTLQSALYDLAGKASLYDVTEGSNGICGEQCEASEGYDLVTGVGSPRHGIDLDLANAP